MPTSHIISRIQSIEARISEIQKINQPAPKVNPKESSTSLPKGETFSEILNEVMKAQQTSPLDFLSDNTSNTTSTLLSKDTLMDLYKVTGTMPITQAKPIPKYTITSTNPGTWDTFIEQTSQQFDIDPKLVHAVIQAESAYNPNAVSRVGAEGLMQLMPYTSERIGIKDSFDPKQNILGGITVLKEMITRYDGDLIKAIAAYNAGPDAVNKANGIPNYKETQEYVPRVLNYYYNLRHE